MRWTMFNISDREKALRTIFLDGEINSDNIKLFEKKEKADFLEAVGQRIGKTKKQVQSIIRRNGLKLDKYPAAKGLIREALIYYNYK